MNLQQLKQEAREVFNAAYTHDGYVVSGVSEEMMAVVFDTLIDKAVDAVEASVVPPGLKEDYEEHCTHCHELDPDLHTHCMASLNERAAGNNDARDWTLEAFRNFRGV